MTAPNMNGMEERYEREREINGSSQGE